MSQKVDELVVSLRLDTAEWEKDYQAAGKKVKDAAKQLTADNKASKVQLQIEMLGADAAAGKMSSLSRQTGLLTGMIDNQRKVVALNQNAQAGLAAAAASHQSAMTASVSKTDAAYKGLASRYAATSAASAAMAARVSAEQLALARLEAQLRGVAAARAAAYTAVAASALGFINNTALALSGIGAASIAMAVKSEQAGKMFEVSFKSSADEVRAWSQTTAEQMGVSAGSLRKYAATFNLLMDNMGLTRGESVRFSEALSELAYNLGAMRGMDPSDVFDKLRAGVAGQTRGLKEMGVVVSDTLVEQYAYTNGIAAQGAKLTEHQQVLARIGVIMKQTGDAANYMAEHSEDAAVKMMKLKAETEEISKSLGKDLLPAYKDLLTVLSDAAKMYAKFQEATNGGTAAIVTAGIEIKAFNMIPMPIWLKIAGDIAIATANLGKYLDKQREVEKANNTKLLTGSAPSSTDANVRWNESIGRWEKEVVEDGVLGLQIKHWAAVSGEELDNLNAKVERNLENMNNPVAPSTKPMTDAEKAREAAKQQQILDEQKKAGEKRIEQENTLQNEIYKITHNELQAELADIDEKARKYAKEYPDMANVAEWAAAKKAKVLEDFENQTMAKINSIYKSALQNRLDDIEREKQAWIKKGVDEVAATKAAETEKRKAVRDAAMQALTQQKEYLDMIKNAMTGEFSTMSTRTGADGKSGGKIVSVNGAGGGTQEERLAAVMQKIVEMEQKRLGIDPSYKVTPELMSVFSQIMNKVQGNIIPGLEEDRSLISNGIQRILGTNVVGGGGSAGQRSGNVITISPTININYPKVDSEQNIAELADKVADVIQPAVINAIGGNTNGY